MACRIGASLQPASFGSEAEFSGMAYADCLRRPWAWGIDEPAVDLDSQSRRERERVRVTGDWVQRAERLSPSCTQRDTSRPIIAPISVCVPLYGVLWTPSRLLATTTASVPVPVASEAFRAVLRTLFWIKVPVLLSVATCTAPTRAVMRSEEH